MQVHIKNFYLFLFSILIISSCKNKDIDSPYSDILTRPPFDLLTDSIRHAPKDDNLYFKRAVLLNLNNFPEPSLADFKKAWSLQKKEEYALGAGNLLLENKPDSAIVFLQSALQFLPKSFMLRLTLANAFQIIDKTDTALAIANQLLDEYPEQVDVMKMKAQLLVSKNDDAAALQILEKAYQLTPYDLELNYQLAFKYAEAKNPKVIALCDSLIQKDSMGHAAEPYYFKGIYYSNTHDNGKALAMFNQAIQNNYSYLNAYIEKGRIYFVEKKYTDALQTFQLANKVSTTFPDAYYWMGRCQEAMGQKDEARLNYERAYGLDNSFTEARESAEKLK